MPSKNKYNNSKLSKQVVTLTVFTILSVCSTPFLNNYDASANSNVRVYTKLNSTISLTTSDSIGIQINPVAGGAFASADGFASVSTNNQSGYTLTLSAKTDETSLIHSRESISDHISSVLSPLSADNMPSNTWGYSTDDTLFNAIPKASAPANIKVTTSATSTAEETTNFSVGVKANTEIASGRYSNTLILSAISNPAPAFGGITKMQEMTPDICADEITPGASDFSVPTALLTDTRDGKSYIVSKFADGKCWMAQNLAIGGSQAITLTPEDSNVTSNYTLGPAINYDISSNSDAYFWEHENSSTYGNYYNWRSVTAGSGVNSITTREAPQSICPKGWRLPTGGDNGEYVGLITEAYGIESNEEGSAKLQSTPLSFPLSGERGDPEGVSRGNYWTSTAGGNSDYAYGLLVIDSAVHPVNYYGRYRGISARCVAE